MTKTERKYLRSLYFWFTEQYNLNQSITNLEMQKILASLKIYNEGIFEVLSLEGNEYDEYDLIALFDDHKIPFKK